MVSASRSILGAVLLISWTLADCTGRQTVVPITQPANVLVDTKPPRSVVTLEILQDGTFVWNGERVPDAAVLDLYWKAAAAEQPQPKIHLKPNREGDYDSVARALEGAQRNGVTN
jgi:biopolymer transport protein ExbD